MSTLGNDLQRSQVSLAGLKKGEIDTNDLVSAVQQAFSPWGGIEHFVRPGHKVLLKPNQTLFMNALKGSTTLPALMLALIQECFRVGAREVWVAEASGHGQETRRVMTETGMAQALKKSGAQMIYLDEIGENIYDFGEDAGDLRYMPAPEIMERADVIINVPKAKTHFVDPVSCACKNWVGVMPMSYRLVLQRQGEPYYRGNALLLRKFRPNITVVDGTIAGEGQGPGATSPFWWGWILASDDPVAVDVTVSQLFGLPWEKCRMAEEAGKLGVGIFNPQKIDIVGATFQEAQVHVKAADPGIHRYPCNVIAGPSSNMEGGLGHWKTIADTWLDADAWDLFTAKGRPTFLFDDAVDPNFEEHVKEGPYVVLGDLARDEYKYDSRVVYVPGMPVPQTYIQHEMVEGMGFGAIYEPGLRLYKTISSLTGRLGGAAGSPVRRSTLSKFLIGIGIAVGLPLTLRALSGRGRQR